LNKAKQIEEYVESTKSVNLAGDEEESDSDNKEYEKHNIHANEFSFLRRIHKKTVLFCNTRSLHDVERKETIQMS
jgi:hypothetical protein